MLTRATRAGFFADMRTLALLGVAVLAVVTFGGCSARRIVVSKSPEGVACQRECAQFFNECYQGKRKNSKLCSQRERECLLRCPGAHVDDDE